MSASETPKPYEEWRASPFDRAEDAAYTFGYDLINHCRQETLELFHSAAVPSTPEEFHDQLAKAVDAALLGVLDLLEGACITQAGPNHRVDYALSVCVKDATGTALVERIDISPCMQDLPIGYGAWRDGEFR